jgi:hypothetical protein
LLLRFYVLLILKRFYVRFWSYLINPKHLMKLLKLIFLALCCPIAVFCQDITGLWTGTIFNEASNLYYDYEIAISKEHGKYVGFSQTLFLAENRSYFGLKKLKVKVLQDGKVMLEDGGLVLNKNPQQTSAVRQLNVLRLQTDNGEDFLSGVFMTNKTKKFAALTGKVKLKKKANLSSSEFTRYYENIIRGAEYTYVPAEEEASTRD